MEIVNKQEQKSKAFAISSIMKNPDLARAISESCDAQIGSTKREKAKSILKSIYKIDNNFNIHDGKGGPGDPSKFGAASDLSYDEFQNRTSSQYTDQDPQEEDVKEFNPNTKTQFIGDVGSLMVSSKDLTPPKDDGSGLMSPEGAPTIGSDIGKTIFSIGNAQEERRKRRIARAEKWQKEHPSILGKYEGSDIDVIGMGVNNALTWANNKYRDAKYPGKYKDEEYMKLSDINESGIGKTDSKAEDVLNVKNPYFEEGVGTWNPKTQTYELGYSRSTGTTSKSNPDLDDPIPSGGLEGQLDSDGNIIGSEITPRQLFDAPPEIQEQRRAGLSDEEKEADSELSKALAQGIGSEAWSLKVMNDKKLMTDLGFPQSTIDLFPQGSSLTSNLKSLWERKKEEKHLDSQLDMLLKMKNQSATIDNDLTAYIRGKDTYLQKITDLKTDAETDYAYSDTSDPNVARRAQNYLNYLTVLEGRQQGRYDNFLKLATDSNTAQLDQMQSLYDSTYAKAREEYNFEAGITEESYNNIKTMIKDMYDNVGVQEEKVRETTRYKHEQKKNAADLADIAAKTAKTKAETKIIEENGSNESSNYAKYDEKLVHNTLFHSYDSESDTNNFDTYSPLDIYKDAVRNNINPEDAINEFFSLHKKDLAARGAANDGSTLKNYTDTIKEYDLAITGNDEAIASYKSKGTDITPEEAALKSQIENSQAILAGIRERMYNMVTSTRSSSLDKLVESNSEKISDVLIDLTGIGLNYKEKPKDRDGFINRHKNEGVDSVLVGLIFDSYQNSVANNNAFHDDFVEKIKDSTNEELVSMVQELISQ